MRRVHSLALLVVYLSSTLHLPSSPFKSERCFADDVPFHPRFDGVERRKKAPAVLTPLPEVDKREIYSFERFSPFVKQVCELLESDGRMTELYEMARVRSRDPSLSTSYRALLREIALRCKPKLELPTPSNGEQTPAAEITPAAAQRYPSTALLDRVSALSSAMYERDPGNGPVFHAVRELADTLRKESLEVPGERDYFAIFNEYLLSAWHGRPEAPLEPTQPSQADIHSLFQ